MQKGNGGYGAVGLDCGLEDDLSGAIRDPLILKFLGLLDEYSEADVEEALVTHLERFLLELGNDSHLSRAKSGCELAIVPHAWGRNL